MNCYRPIHPPLGVPEILQKAARVRMRMKMILETSIVVTTVTVAAEITCLEVTMTCRRFHV